MSPNRNRGSSAPDTGAVLGYLRDLQDRVCTAVEAVEGEAGARFVEDAWEGPAGGGRSRVLEGGGVFERGGVNFSHVRGERLPPAASARRPELEGRGFEVMGVSVIFHPLNPYVPTSHLNVRFFTTREAIGHDPAEPAWWFGGGFDLTPFYGFAEDAAHWHRTARWACAGFGEDLYTRLKQWCDEYFYLPHRQEPRGVGGLFFDDFDEGGFDRAFAFCRSVGDHYLEAYLPLVERRKDTPYGERERDFQLLRRGRYVEFNLVCDRGTSFGLQSKGRTESILVSMPPLARWRYDWRPEPGSPEARLYEEFLLPRDWTGEGGGP